MLKNLSSR